MGELDALIYRVWKPNKRRLMRSLWSDREKKNMKKETNRTTVECGRTVVTSWGHHGRTMAEWNGKVQNGWGKCRNMKKGKKMSK